ncbi:hypothetical protein L7F22_050574 [Adiantum nelumboides]|nr:hypothetical protein [Adiantum nelumboides]
MNEDSNLLIYATKWSHNSVLHPSQKTKKSKFLISSLIQDTKKWFGNWNVQEYVDMQIEQGKEHEYMLNFDIAILQSLHEKWQNAMHRSKWEYYCKHINPKYWDNYKVSKPEAQPHVSTPMSYKARHAITMMRMRSHMLKIETGSWLKMDRNQRKCIACSMQAIEDEAHVALECSAYAHIRADFQQVLQDCHTFEELLTKVTTALGFFFHRILEHHTLLREKEKRTPNNSNTHPRFEGTHNDKMYSSKPLRRLYHALDEANSAAATAVATGNEAENPQPTKQLPRLWAMQRLSTSKRHLVAAMKAWRIPGAYNKPLDWLPPGLGCLLFMDRLQVNKFYWEFGYPGFICKRFHLDIYDPSWERNHNTARVIGSLEVYAHMVSCMLAFSCLQLH